MSDSKMKILEAASEIFLEGGISALSVRAIAARAGISTIGIYSYFKGKQGILDALYIEGFEKISAAMNVAAIVENPRDAVLRASLNYLRTVEQFKAHNRLIFGEIDKSFTPSVSAQAAGAKAFEQLVTLVSILLPKDARLAEKQKLALGIWAVVHGFTGLRQHAVAEIVNVDDWEEMIINSLDRYISAQLDV